MLEDKLRQEMTKARKTGDTNMVSVLRLLLSAIHNEQIAQGKVLDDAAVEKVLMREAKRRKESIEAFEAGGRPEKAKVEKGELRIIQSYLPEPIKEEEIAKVVDEVVAGNPQASFGAVMGQVMQKLGGRAEGGTVARIVREKLGSHE